MQLLALFPFQRKRLAQFFSPSHHRIFGARDILGGHVDTPTTKLSPREPAHASCEREVQGEIYDHSIQLVVKNRYFFQSLSSLENEPVKILSSSLKILLVNLCLRLLGKGPGQGMSDRTSKMRGLNQHPL